MKYFVKLKGELPAYRNFELMITIDEKSATDAVCEAIEASHKDPSLWHEVSPPITREDATNIICFDSAAHEVDAEDSEGKHE